MVTAINKAWAAGFFDGEGSIYINKTAKGYYSLQVKIGQVEKSPLEKFSKLFGGNVTQPSSGVYYWSLSNKEALVFLASIRKYLVNKQSEANVALQYKYVMIEKGQHKLTPSQLKGRELLRKTLQNIKKRKYGKRH